MVTAEQIIEHFKLEKLPREGGFFVETYRSPEILPRAAFDNRYSSDKTLGTAIFYLLTDDPDSFSALHKLLTDEIYHFYLGDPVQMLNINPDGSSKIITLGQDILNGQHVQYTVKRGVWQGSRVRPGGTWALMGTTMAPGYDNDDNTIGKRDDLIKQYPDLAEWIHQLTRA